MSTVAVRANPHLFTRRKSRFGCRNCKLRKVKCDETRPHCTKCSKYGVLCNFTLTIPDLQPISEKRSGPSKHQLAEIVGDAGEASTAEKPSPTSNNTEHALQLRRRPRPTIRSAPSNGIWASDGHTQYMLDTQDCVLFTKFRSRTLYSLGGQAMVDIYENYMLEKCFAHPFLMHGTLAVAAVHDRYLFDEQSSTSVVPYGPSRPRTRAGRELFHVARCTSLFNDWLSQPMTEDRKDPIWSGAGMLSILTFASSTARRPEDAWPLGPPEPSSDLEWLRLGAGKMTLWHMLNPMREGSVFRPMFQVLGDPHGKTSPVPRVGNEGLLPDLARICGIDEYSTRETNPYFVVAHSLSRLLSLSYDNASLGKVLMVAGKMHDAFEVLLHQRDPVALLLLCLWYGKAGQCKWWIAFRTRYEIPAICQYLNVWHADKVAIHKLLRQFGIPERDYVQYNYI
ncbi:hypothetical protein HMPREF1624_08747 [Sporothrix schenckii ATCC 58251]|uniref:Zn(2)-C6 fungal-type domain-containing protein n=1 Tax=Sporothrix schenckii (strain ATCC 58251 / de Perez 2211183) TaxID=1391915 RepID=U7PJX6_SPOS1|nr:hypothetical protein HMPREF1624_08747 [Sporothrix schenckii ATCC 58251]